MVAPEIPVLLESESLRRLRGLLEHREDALLTLCDPEARILWATAPGTRGLLGDGQPELTGRALLDVVHPSDATTVRVGLETALAGHSVRFGFRVRTADGQWRPTSATCWALGPAQANSVVVILVAEGEVPDVLELPLDLSHVERRGPAPAGEMA